jgi:hypothetical protein
MTSSVILGFLVQHQGKGTLSLSHALRNIAVARNGTDSPAQGSAGSELAHFLQGLYGESIPQLAPRFRARDRGLRAGRKRRLPIERAAELLATRSPFVLQARLLSFSRIGNWIWWAGAATPSFRGDFVVGVVFNPHDS